MPATGFQQVDLSKAQEFWDYLSPQTAAMNVRDYIFRGQPDARFGLIPPALRWDGVLAAAAPGKNRVNSLQISEEMKILADFVRQCDHLGLAIPQDSIAMRSKLDWLVTGGGEGFMQEPSRWPPCELVGLLALAQHHKIPTRLLDWSRRSHVAVYFAASSALARDEDWEAGERLAVWALDSGDLRHLDPSHESAGRIGAHPYVRLVTAPGAVTVNLAAQAGVFTLLIERGGQNDAVKSRSLESEFGESPGSLWKITLPVTECMELLRICRLYAITAATLFPRYDGASAAALEEWAEDRALSRLLYQKSRSGRRRKTR